VPAALAERGRPAGRPRAPLLLLARTRRHGSDYAEAHHLLATCPDPGALLSDLLAGTERPLQLTAANRRAPGVLTDPQLSSRKPAVLRLLAG